LVGVNRLVQWDPFRIRVDADAVAAILHDRLPAASVTFADGEIDVAAGPVHARVTIAAIAPHELRLSIALKDGQPAILITVLLTSLLPGFVDVAIEAAEITKEGLLVSLGAGGADPPPA